MIALRWIVLIAVLVAAAARSQAEPLDEGAYAELLARHTESVESTVGTRVDYAALAASPDWKRLIRSLSRVEPAALATRDQKLAFWINAYNILAIDIVLRHYPVESIRDIGSLFRPVWNREAGRIGGKPYTLDQIEHEILRKLDEPRIHFAIVCASTSCPSLPREPFTAERLDAQLDEATRRFLESRTKGLRVESGDEIRVSKIFDWFEEDFEAVGGVVAFVRRYAPESARRRMGPEPDVEHFDYDWRLNDAGRGRRRAGRDE